MPPGLEGKADTTPAWLGSDAHAGLLMGEPDIGGLHFIQGPLS